MLIAGRSGPLSADSSWSARRNDYPSRPIDRLLWVFISQTRTRLFWDYRALCQRRARASLFVPLLINLLGFPRELARFLKQGSKYPTHETVPDPSHGQKFQTLAAAASVSIDENLSGVTQRERVN